MGVYTGGQARARDKEHDARTKLLFVNSFCAGRLHCKPRLVSIAAGCARWKVNYALRSRIYTYARASVFILRWFVRSADFFVFRALASPPCVRYISMSAARTYILELLQWAISLWNLRACVWEWVQLVFHVFLAARGMWGGGCALFAIVIPFALQFYRFRKILYTYCVNLARRMYKFYGMVCMCVCVWSAMYFYDASLEWRFTSISIFTYFNNVTVIIQIFKIYQNYV